MTAFIQAEVHLQAVFDEIAGALDTPAVAQPDIAERIAYICRYSGNRAGARVLLACSLAKLTDDNLDIRQPYTEIEGRRTYSGRMFDERFIGPFVTAHHLPCNPTTAFLTPALRNRNTTLTPDIDLSGKPKALYSALLQLLTDVHDGTISARQLLAETLRQLVLYRDEQSARIAASFSVMEDEQARRPLSSEQIITLIAQHLAHLATRGASRLPVLVVAAAYTAVAPWIQEQPLPLERHNAADSQTNALGDIQIALSPETHVVTCYEMKMKRVTIGDIELAVRHKLVRAEARVDNYIFITTEAIDREVHEFAASIYDQVGVEVVVLCWIASAF